MTGDLQYLMQDIKYLLALWPIVIYIVIGLGLVLTARHAHAEAQARAFILRRVCK